MEATLTILFSLEFLSRGIRAIVKNTSPTTLTRNYDEIKYIIQLRYFDIIATNLSFPLLHGRVRDTGGKRRTSSLHDAGIAVTSVSLRAKTLKTSFILNKQIDSSATDFCDLLDNCLE